MNLLDSLDVNGRSIEWGKKESKVLFFVMLCYSLQQNIVFPKQVGLDGS